MKKINNLKELREAKAALRSELETDQVELRYMAKGLKEFYTPMNLLNKVLSKFLPVINMAAIAMELIASLKDRIMERFGLGKKTATEAAVSTATPGAQATASPATPEDPASDGLENIEPDACDE